MGYLALLFGKGTPMKASNFNTRFWKSPGSSRMRSASWCRFGGILGAAKNRSAKHGAVDLKKVPGRRKKKSLQLT